MKNNEAVGKTGLIELKEEATKLSSLIDEVNSAIPYADSKLKKQMLKTSMSLTDLIEILKLYDNEDK